MKFETRVRTHPKIEETIEKTGRCDAAWLWFAGSAYSRDALTDGFVADRTISTLIPGLPARSLKGLPQVLVDAGLWHRVEGGYQIHDFLHFNQSKAEVEAKREADRLRKRGVGATESDGIPDGTSVNSSRNPSGVLEDSIASRTRVTPAGASSTSSLSGSSEGVPGEPPPSLPDGVHRGPKRHGGLIARPGAWGNVHSGHLVGFCDWMCLPLDNFGQFATRMGSEARAKAWAVRVRADFEARRAEPTGKPWDFWREQFDARPRRVDGDRSAIPQGREIIAEQDRIASTLEPTTGADVAAALQRARAPRV